MELKKFAWVLTVMVFIGLVGGLPHRILVDTDVDTDDFFALFYLLKLNRSEFDLQAVTINANAWSNAAAAVNHVYDILYMMNRDDVSVGVGGEGGILDDGTILPNVGGYLPLIEQGKSTAGNWRYRQAIPVGSGGRLDVDTNFGFRRGLLPQSYFMWDSFTAGIAVSTMRLSNNNDSGENEFAELEYMNITVITSNDPYGISDGSNPFYDNRKVPKFNLMRNGVHSGHIQTGLRDPFCRGQNGKGICKDGYTEETSGQESVRVRVATKAKPNPDVNSNLDREFFKSFLEVLNRPQNSGRFNFTTQFAHYAEVLYKPDFRNRKLGRPIVFDMDMSAGDFLALFYLLKVPVEELNLKAILVSPTGWANAATIDVVYDFLHMMGRDDIPVGLGDVYAMNQSDPIFSGVGGCKYSKSIPNGGGGFLDSDTLYGLARNLPRGPRRYTAENSAKFGAPRDTEHPELRQPSAQEVWDVVLETLDAGSKITILTNGPLTSLASIVRSEKNSTSSIQDVYIVGGHIRNNKSEKGNVFTIPSNEYAEFNMFLDPFAAKTVFESGLDIKLIPLSIQRRVSAFTDLLAKLRRTKKTPEALFSQRLLSRLYRLQQAHHRYKHMETFVGEVLGAVILASDVSDLSASFTTIPIKVSATGEETEDGQLSIDEKQGKLVKVLEDVDVMEYYNLFTDRLGDKQQSAVIGSFDEQRRKWSSPSNMTG